MKSIGIIGGGFSGLMVAYQLVKNTSLPIRVCIFNKHEFMARGTAYSVDKDFYLLNVIAAKMSALPDDPDHFLNWVMQTQAYKSLDRSMISQAFLPRKLYGEYLSDLWEKLQQSASDKGCLIEQKSTEICSVSKVDELFSFTCRDGVVYPFDVCVLATGNELPKTPNSITQEMKNSGFYFGNPWSSQVLKDVDEFKQLLIIGNGLTMVDTVIGLQQSGFKGTIYSISPNGFNILPHRNNGLVYKKLNEEILGITGLRGIATAVFKHIRIVRKFGLSAEPVIDSLRPNVQHIWQHLHLAEKKVFLSRLRHLWGVARHRIPLHIHDRIQQLRIEKKLHIIAGKINAVNLNQERAIVDFYNKKTGIIESVQVDRIINCTGPNSDMVKTSSTLLKQLINQGLICQDELKLGLKVDINSYQVIKQDGKVNQCFYTLGNHLRGELWESTAVNELRQQAKEVAQQILAHA
jgi:uncharacterized NAD(P)/FAD-binding protein YdhS